MALGITNVDTSYNMVGSDCIMSSTAKYTLEDYGWYQIGACIPRTSTCYAFCEQFYVPAGGSTSGQRDLYDINVGGGAWQSGDKIDVTLFKSPYSFPSDTVGKQKEITLEDCIIQICTPGDRICDGNFVYECNTLGTAYDVLVEYCSHGCTNGMCNEALSLDTVTCEGFQEDCSPYRVEQIFGKTLYNSTTYPDICDWFDHACDFYCTFKSWNTATTFDLSELTRNEHEVVTTYVDINGLATNAQYNVLAKWYDPNNENLFTNNSGYFTGTTAYRWVCWAGYCDWEISTNGTHKVIVELYEDDNLIMTKTLNFEITGITCPLPTCDFGVL